VIATYSCSEAANLLLGGRDVRATGETGILDFEVEIIMDPQNLETLKANVDRLVKINSFDGEVIVGKVHFVSEEDEDVIYDLVSTSRESQYEKLDQQPAYRIRFQDIESVEVLPSHPSRTGSTATGTGGPS